MTTDLTSILKSRSARWVLGLVVLVSIAWQYSPHLSDSLLSDDFYYLRIYETGESAGGFSDAWWNVTVGGLNFHFRPVFGVTGWLLYHLSGRDPFGWHLLNLCLHLGCVALVIALTGRVTASKWAPIAAGLLFGLHFINAESVVWISARTSLLAAFFVLLAAVLESAPRQRQWDWHRHVALLSGILALLSKENAVVLPLLLMLIPSHPYRLTDAVEPKAPVRAWPRLFQDRARGLWPYWALAVAFVAVRFGAIIAGTRGTVYRIEFGLNVVKNALFALVSSLFPADFRAALAAWNNWYEQRDYSALFNWLAGRPELIIGAIVAVLFWGVALAAGRPGVRRMAAWLIVAALPTLVFRGTGERLMYLGVAGASAAIAILLAGWHQAFVQTFGRPGRWLAPMLFVIYLTGHGIWLNAKLRDWRSASDLTEVIIARMCEAAADVPPGRTIRFANLPDNIRGAWVFRLGAPDAFRLYCGRPDLTPVSSPSSDSVDVVLRWNGASCVRVQ